jgi:hypothetical protein
MLEHVIAENRAILHLMEGKRHLHARAPSAALTPLRRANEHLRRPKLTAVIWLVRHLPTFVAWALAMRGLLLQGKPDHRLGIDHPRGSSAALARPRTTQTA